MDRYFMISMLFIIIELSSTYCAKMQGALIDKSPN